MADALSTNFANSIIFATLLTGALLFNHYAPLQDARPLSREPLIMKPPRSRMSKRGYGKILLRVAKAEKLNQRADCEVTAPDRHCQFTIERMCGSSG